MPEFMEMGILEDGMVDVDLHEVASDPAISYDEAALDEIKEFKSLFDAPDADGPSDDVEWIEMRDMDGDSGLTVNEGPGEDLVEGAGGEGPGGAGEGGNGNEPAENTNPDSPSVRSRILNSAKSAMKWSALQLISATIQAGVAEAMSASIKAATAKPKPDAPATTTDAKVLEHANIAFQACLSITKEWRQWLVAHHGEQKRYGTTKAGILPVENYEIFFRTMVDVDRYRNKVGAALVKAKLAEGGFDANKAAPVNKAIGDYVKAINEISEQLVQYKLMTKDGLDPHAEEIKAVLDAYPTTA